MKLLFLIVLLVPVFANVQLKAHFDSFLKEYGKHYEGAEYERRMRIFEENLRIAAENQAKDSSAEHGVTKFFDMSFEEFKATMLMEEMPSAVLAPNCLKHGVYHPASLNKIKLPDSFDWRDHDGVVTSVKDQGSCGSCWAFSTAANIEGVLGVNGQGVGDISPQEIVDCSKGCSSEWYQGRNITVCNGGCNGGWPWSAFWDIMTPTSMGAIHGWTDYPYTGYTGSCRKLPSPKVTVHIANYTCITQDEGLDEDTMAQALLTYGPLSIAINANSFFSYKSGIMDIAGCETAYVNHAITLVGFGVENGKKFWTIKNSWAASWGEKGYIRVVRGKGMCGVNEGVSTATI